MPRILGQETSVVITSGNTALKAFSAIKSCKFVFKGEAIKSDYLGQPGPVFDEVSDGVEVSLDFEPDTPDYFDVLERLIQRKQGLLLFDAKITTRFNFRTGVSRLCVVPDVSFADLPLEIPERKQKVRGSLQGFAQIARFPRNV